jgi:hypothetical protein
MVLKIIYLLTLIYIISSCTQQNTSQKIENSPFTQNQDFYLYSLEMGNQDSLIYYVEISKTWLDSLQKKYPWDKFDQYSNRLLDGYMEKLFDSMVEKSDAETSIELWEKCTKPQKLLWTFLVFNGQTNNGGVYQFLFNSPKFSKAALEMMKELNLKTLEKDYLQILTEISGKESINEDYFNQTKAFEDNWKAFNERQNEIISLEQLEEYYYTIDFKKKYYKIIADYLEENMHLLAVIK